ncbi:hypothetical protein [Protaetiibacter intestinalis]|uniref:Glycerophosphoryl diester phosphodiesterase membrane domain-containing protein n=1 Tax=Protaetiibacter intestinalis TaxID=2419774 RepID=A0A387B0Z0_9MICO|nr:hypothetical protein [Protaetiibacter intestinalis]AYF97162.1 hypothetical protein D7I47_02150 [Protaetiibacter intestinalis]
MTQPIGAFPAPTWTPPPREPFVPLRPLTLGQILSGAFRTLRHNPAVTLGPSIVISLAAALLALGVSTWVIDPLVDGYGSGAGSSRTYDWLVGFGAGLIGWMVVRVLATTAGVLQQGVSAADVSHAVLGRRLTTVGLRRRTRGVRGPLAAWAVIVSVVLLVAGLLGAALIGAAAMADAAGSVLIAALVYTVAAVLLAWIGTRLAFVPSVLVVERLPLGRAIGRARRLTRHQFWRTFGIRILCWSMIWLATLLVGIPVQLIIAWLGSIVAGNGATSDQVVIMHLSDIATAVVGAIIGAIGLVITTATDAILYLDLRMRQEGLDLELGRFMEHRRPGTRFDPAEVDPYRTPGAAAPASANPGASAWG